MIHRNHYIMEIALRYLEVELKILHSLQVQLQWGNKPIKIRLVYKNNRLIILIIINYYIVYLEVVLMINLLHR